MSDTASYRQALLPNLKRGKINDNQNNCSNVAMCCYCASEAL